MEGMRMKLEGNWQVAKGRILEAWGDLTDDEIDRVKGRWDELVGTIRKKTGSSVEMIEDRLDRIVDSLPETS